MNSTITYLPNATTIRPLSLQAATWSYVSNPLALREGGCLLNSGEQNCSKACKDVNLLFRDGATFENCLSYPLISQVLAETNASSAEPAIGTYGILPNDVDGSRDIISAISQCFVGYVRTLPNCQLSASGQCSGDAYTGCPEALLQTNQTGIFPIDASNPSQSTSYECINSLCGYVAQNSQVSADVGGIGVWISYVIQILICLIFWLVIEYFRFIHPMIIRRMQKKNPVVSKRHGSTQKEMFVETVIDFHKCQCYFMATILLAAIIATQRGGLGAFTLQDIFTNLVLLSVLSIGGSLPIMFLLYKLRLMGHVSWFSFLLSTISLALSFGLVWTSGPHKNINYLQLEQGTFTIPDCGTIIPTALCLQGFETIWAPGDGTTVGNTNTLYASLYFRTYAAFALSLVFWLGLLFEKFVEINVKTMERLFQRSIKLTEHNERIHGMSRHKQLAVVFMRTIDFIACFGTVYVLALYLQSLWKFGIGSTEWTFGQIVALTIWVPPVAQYIYLQLHGVEGNRWHLPKTLTVTRLARRPKSQNGSEHNQDGDQVDSNSLNAASGITSRPRSAISYTKVPAQRCSSRNSEHNVSPISDARDDIRGPERIYALEREKGSFSELDDYNVGHS